MANTVSFADTPGDEAHALTCDLINAWLPPGLAAGAPIHVVGVGSTRDSLWPTDRDFYLNACAITKRGP